MRPMHVDGLIFVLIAFFGAIASSLSSDDAAKYIGPMTLWYEKNICTAIAAALLALKMYRSTSYATDAKEQDQKKTGNTDFLVKPPAVVTVEKPSSTETTFVSAPTKAP